MATPVICDRCGKTFNVKDSFRVILAKYRNTQESIGRELGPEEMNQEVCGACASDIRLVASNGTRG